MFFIINKNILHFILVFGFCFCLCCNQKSTAISEATLASQPTPLIIASKEIEGEEIKYKSPFDTCQKIKSKDDRSLCEAIIKELDLIDEDLVSDFVYTQHRIDLNGDGHNEVLVWTLTQGLGGTSGYPLIIFSQNANGYHRLWDTDKAWTPVLVLKSKSHDWQDVAFQIGGGGVDWDYAILRHNGKTYDVHVTQEKQPKGKLLIGKDWHPSVFGSIPNQE